MRIEVPDELADLFRHPEKIRKAFETLRALENLTVRDANGVRRPIRISPHNATIDLGPTAAEPTTGSEAPAGDPPIAFWAFDEASGTAVDVVGGYNLDPNNITYSTGKIGNAAFFNGSNSQLSRDQSLAGALSFTGDFSFSFWINISAQPTGTLFPIVGKFLFVGSDDRQYLIMYEDAGGGIFNLCANLSSNGTASTKHNVANTLTIGTWHHIVCTYNAALGLVEFFKDGSSVGTASHGITSLFAGGAHFWLGTISGFSAWFNGGLDMLAAWDRVITADEIAALYNGGAGAPPDY